MAGQMGVHHSVIDPAIASDWIDERQLSGKPAKLHPERIG
jgi:hypothetical protein